MAAKAATPAARTRTTPGPGAPLRLAVLGAGQLGETLIRGLLEAGLTEPGAVVVTTLHATRSRDLARRLGVRAAASNAEAVSGASVVLLTVKPQQVVPVLREVGPLLTASQLVISAASSVSTAVIEKHLSALAPGARAGAKHLAHAEQLFGAVGQTVVLDERHMDAVTGLSASGPAFLYIVIESLADGGVKVGLPRDVALRLAAQTVLGAGAMVRETGEHPALLKDAVTTPSGTTIDGILELEEGGLRVALIKAVVRATRRATERAHELFGDQLK